MKNKYALAAIAIPFLLLSLLIIRAEYHLQSGAQWQFEISGYDPRDLLRGHYLQFSINYNFGEHKNSCSNIKNCCLCLTNTTSQVPEVEKTSCEIAKTQCDGFMLSQYQHALNRFYIPENKAKEAEEILLIAQGENNAFLTVAVNKKGEPTIVDLNIGEQSINNLIAK